MLALAKPIEKDRETPEVAPENCLDCRHHEVVPDPDPVDWLLDDNKAVICRLTENPSQDIGSKYLSDRDPNRAVTISCRPYDVRKESEHPDWCPLQCKKENM